MAYIHGVVLISEMYPFLNWQDVARILKAGSSPKEKIMLYTMDLPDFERLSHVAQNPASFGNLMLDRFLLMLSRKNAFIIGKTSTYE